MASVEMQKAAAELIERSRAGDQNATAMIIEIRRAALRGVKKAQIGFDLLRRLVEANPHRPEIRLDGSDRMGAEGYEALGALAKRGPILALAALVIIPSTGGEDGITAAAVLLANGPQPITKRLVSDIAAGIDETQHRKLFFYGVQCCGLDGRSLADELSGRGDEPLFVHAGRCVGLARSIQRVRLPNSRISAFNVSAGWELGE